MNLTIQKQPNRKEVLSNIVFLNPEDHKELFGKDKKCFLKIKNIGTYRAESREWVKKGKIALNNVQRVFMDIGRKDHIPVKKVDIPTEEEEYHILEMKITFKSLFYNKKGIEIPSKSQFQDMIKEFDIFSSNHLLCIGQPFLFNYDKYIVIGTPCTMSVGNPNNVKEEKVLEKDEEGEKEEKVLEKDKKQVWGFNNHYYCSKKGLRRLSILIQYCDKEGKPISFKEGKIVI